MRTTKDAFAALLFVMGTQAHAQLLKGMVKGEKVEDAVISYSPDGYAVNAQVIDLGIKEDGSFVFDMDFNGDETDVEVLLGDNMLGAHLAKGKTLVMDIQKTDGGYEVQFKGDEARLSSFVNMMKQAYDGMRYWSPDPSTEKSNAEYRALLEKENKKVKELLPTLKDKKQQTYYAKLADYNYRWCKLRLIMDEYGGRKDADYRKDADFKVTLADIDVNDPIAYQTNLSLTKVFASTTCAQDASEKFCREVMKLIDDEVTLPSLRSTMVMMIGQQYLMSGEAHENHEAFINDLKAWAGKDAPMLDTMIQQFLDKIKSQKEMVSGTKVPDITLTDAQGKNVRLSELLQSKFTYIDVWATWCGPCKREIPFVAKLVEKYKGADNIQFLSISVDENVDAWKKMIEADKPAWPQFNINGAVNAEFSKQWGITGIPRFIMIDEKGNIFNADAPRPSNEETSAILDKVVGGK